MFNLMSRTRIMQAAGLISLVTVVGYVSLQASTKEPLRLASAQALMDAEKEVDTYLAEVAAAFNKRDAKAVSALFSPKGELVDADGNVLNTRAGLEAHYAEIFSKAKQAQISVVKQSLRVINDNLALYDGVATVKHSENVPARESRFGAVLTKEGDRWYIASIRDLEELDNGPAMIQEKLGALKWLVGDWVEVGGAYRIHTSCQWSDDKLALIQQISISGPSLKELKATQRISWDPATQKIKSWTHDSLGGHTEALWTASGDQWIVKSSGFNSEGEAVSMTMTYHPIDKGRIDLYSRDRIVGDEVMPDIAVTLVQRPPEPKP